MEEKEKITQRPPLGFTIWLYFFMVLIVMEFMKMFSTYQSTFQDMVYGYSILTTVLALVSDLLIYSYAIFAICLSLSANRSSITMLRISIIYISLQHLMSGFDKLGRGVPPVLILDFPIFLLLCIFLLYLSKSSSLHLFLPKKERKFGLQGWIGIFIWCIALSSMLSYSLPLYLQSVRSRPVPVEELMLEKDEFSDGRSIYRPLSSWVQDTVIVRDENVQYIASSKDYDEIVVTTISHTCKNRTDYYLLARGFMKANYPECRKLKEISYSDTTISGSVCYSNIYELEECPEGYPEYLIFSALVSDKDGKTLTLSAVGHSLPQETDIPFRSFLEGVSFDLEERRIVQE